MRFAANLLIQIFNTCSLHVIATGSRKRSRNPASQDTDDILTFTSIDELLALPVPKLAKTTEAQEDIRGNSKNVDCIISPRSSYIGKFRHEDCRLFLQGHTRFFEVQDFRKHFKRTNRRFIEEFCTQKELWEVRNKILQVDKDIEENFEILEINLKRVVCEYLETERRPHFLPEDYDRPLRKFKNSKKALDPPRTASIYYLLIFSFYETCLFGIPDSQKIAEKVLFNIVAYIRLNAKIHNVKIRKLMRLNKVLSQNSNITNKSLVMRKKVNKNIFNYSDFTRSLCGKPTNISEDFYENMKLLKGEIFKNIQLIIRRELKNNTELIVMCQHFLDLPLEFDKSLLFDKFVCELGFLNSQPRFARDIDYFNFILSNGFPYDLFACFMNTATKELIANLPSLQLKSIFILIYITKICLHEVNQLCTVPEYLILVTSLFNEYLECLKNNNAASDEFQSLISYLFSLHYLDNSNDESIDDIKIARDILKKKILGYNDILIGFDDKIDQLPWKSMKFPDD